MASYTSIREHAAILIIGDSGSHKTYLSSLFPQPYAFDFDFGMAIAGGRVPFDSFRDWDRTKSTGNKQPPKFLLDQGVYSYGDAWSKFLMRYNALEDTVDKGTCPYKTIIFDSLTTMGYVAMSHVLKTGNDPAPHIGSWGAQQEYLRKIVMGVIPWPMYKIFTAHIQRTENDLTKISEKLPLITGKLAGGIGGLFDEVWYTDWEGEGAKRKYHLLTEPNASMRQAKTRWGIPNKTEMTWEALQKYLVTPSSPAAAA